jgi:hypothetical protein
MVMLCKVCSIEIPAERLEILPHTTTCVKHSVEPKNKAFMVYGHKTGGEVVVVNGSNKEAIRQAERAYARAR